MAETEEKVTKPNPIQVVKKIISAIVEKAQELFQNIPPGILKLVAYSSGAVVILVVIIVLIVQFPAIELKDTSAIPLDSKAINIDQFELPPLPARMQEGEYQAAFPPKPRWDYLDFKAYLPPLRTLLLTNLNKKNQEKFELLLNAISD